MATVKELLARVDALEARLARLEAQPAPVIHRHEHYEQAPPAIQPYAYPRPWWDQNQITCSEAIDRRRSDGPAFWQIPQPVSC